MLKRRVSSLDEVSEVLREHYVQVEDGAFEVEVEGIRALKSALAKEKQHRQNAENRVRELETQVADLRDQPRPKPEDQMTPMDHFLAQAEQRLAQFQRGTPEYDAELARITAELEPVIAAEVEVHSAAGQKKLEALTKDRDRVFIEQHARQIIAEIVVAGSDAALLPHVTQRLGVAIRDGEPTPIVLDEKGNPSSATVDTLKEEFRETPAIRPLLRDPVAESEAHARRFAETFGEQLGPKAVARSAFDRMSAASKAHHVRSGGEVVDDIH